MSSRPAESREWNLPFASRAAAGKALACTLAPYAGRPDVTVLGLARGGVPVAAVVAGSLGAPLAPLVVEKVTVGDHDPYSAIAGVTEARLPPGRSGYAPRSAAVDAARDDAHRRLARRHALYDGAGQPILENRCAILVDDGIKSGLTMLAAARTARQQGASRVVVATPVAPQEAAALLRKECDDFVCFAMPKPFHGIAECYIDFPLLSDETCADIVKSQTDGFPHE